MAISSPHIAHVVSSSPRVMEYRVRPPLTVSDRWIGRLIARGSFSPIDIWFGILFPFGLFLVCLRGSDWVGVVCSTVEHTKQDRSKLARYLARHQVHDKHSDNTISLVMHPDVRTADVHKWPVNAA